MTGDDLYDLLPAVLRLRDAEQGGPLRAVLDVIAEQAAIVQDDIAGLWDDLFVETCADWVLPYLGDLLGSAPLTSAPASGGLGGTGQRPRADVARTISYRRRKGTLTMLEELTRDVTGWPAHAVPFFELLSWTQNLNHLRIEPRPDSAAADRVGTADVRHADAMDRTHGPFDVTVHTADVRPLTRVNGWHGIDKVGLFVWRLGAYRLTGVNARPTGSPVQGWYLSPLGNSAPVFSFPEPVDPGGLSGEPNAAGPIRPIAFRDDPGTWYGPDASLELVTPAGPVPAAAVVGCDLSTWRRPAPGRVAVDVRLGRCTFAAGEDPARLSVSATYGFAADLGGGPYDRRGYAAAGSTDPVAEPDSLDVLLEVPSAGLPDLAAAVAAWNPAVHPRAVIQINDSATYSGCTLDRGGVELVVQAANGQRPLIDGDLVVGGAAPDATLTLDGLLIAGRLDVQGTRRAVRLRHCTLVPGLTILDDTPPPAPVPASVQVAAAGNAGLGLSLADCVSGPVRVPPTIDGLTVTDSVIDGGIGAAGDDLAITGGTGGTDPGPPATIERSTVFGAVQLRSLTLGSESLFVGKLSVERRQGGCVRFSLLTPGSVTPQQYHCQVGPLALFTARRYGAPGYAQLADTAPEGIRTGARNGSEMGAFNRLQQPAREANLRIRLAEYLPFGLDAQLIHVT